MMQPWGCMSKPCQPCWTFKCAWITSLACSEQGWLSEARCSPHNQLWGRIGSFYLHARRGWVGEGVSLISKNVLSQNETNNPLHSYGGLQTCTSSRRRMITLSDSIHSLSAPDRYLFLRCHRCKCHSCRGDRLGSLEHSGTGMAGTDCPPQEPPNRRGWVLLWFCVAPSWVCLVPCDLLSVVISLWG